MRLTVAAARSTAALTLVAAIAISSSIPSPPTLAAGKTEGSASSRARTRSSAGRLPCGPPRATPTPTSKQTASAASSPASTASTSRTTRRPGDGIFHFYFPEQGLVMPGQFIPGADSHSRAYGAYGAVGIGVGSTTLGFGWSTGYIYFTLAQAAPRRVHRAAAALGQRQGHRPRAAAAVGRAAVAGDVGRARGRRPAAADRVSQHDRQHDGGGRSAERHLRARRHHLRVVSRKGHHGRCRIRRSRPAPTPSTRSTKRST